ncbi:MAG: hypothetical protein LAO56_08660 [Acidobacteriia bacterium]|nr:hypothetical protein [Terriglobia bacterium]
MRTNLNVFLFLTLLTCTLAAFPQKTDIAVVVNPGNPVTTLTLPQLRKLLAGERRSWANGQAVRVFVRAPGTRERATLLKLLGMSESEYKQYWTSQVFRGEAQFEPVALPSNGMQKEAIIAIPGAIVLMDSGDVKPPAKVVKIEGRLPGESGYPIH